MKSKKSWNNIPSLDLHGLRYNEVEDTVLNWLLPKSNYQLPVNIITGNSMKMKKVVVDILLSHDYSYINGDTFNRGYIKVTQYKL